MQDLSISYLEQEAAVAKTKSAIASIESEVELKQEEINYLSGVKNLDPIILSHEQAKLKQLKLNHTAAVREYQLAMGKMQTAKTDWRKPVRGAQSLLPRISSLN